MSAGGASWAQDAVFYHIYPLGSCGAPERNDFASAPVPRLGRLHGWLEHLQSLGVSALYLGPVCESSAHGYDTADYFRVDRRLGDNRTLAELSAALHARGMRLVLDGVFHHVGRDFWAFRDLRERGAASPYRDWFDGLSFAGRSPFGDPFSYNGWEGHHELVKLNLRNPAVVAHLLEAVGAWMRDYELDGLRLDVAYLLDRGFLADLAGFCRQRRPGFWLLGEVIHGDYRGWAAPGLLDSVTNYECYKGLYSSLNDRNYFEIAYALNRQFGPGDGDGRAGGETGGGLYRGLPLYNFADNHDVDRVASRLRDPGHLAPLYCLLFTMPGVPSVYYGSEWGLPGRRSPTSDRPLRPELASPSPPPGALRPELAGLIARLSGLRARLPALRRGDYRQLHVGSEQLAFSRTWRGRTVIVALNAAPAAAAVEVPSPAGAEALLDHLDGGSATGITRAAATLRIEVPACAGRVIAPREPPPGV